MILYNGVLSQKLWTRIVATIILVAPSMAIVCYHCDSIALGECAMTLNELDTLPYISCPTELTCKLSIVDSITYRGCGNDTPTIGATYSKTCRDNLCNKGVYPPGRLKCHHCEGEMCVDQPKGKPRPCRYHFEDDECYIEVHSPKLAYRGCASDTNHSITAEAYYCDINGCNDAEAATTLQCAQCDSNITRGCKMDLFNVNTAQCNITLYETCSVVSLLTHKESCFTYQLQNRVVRGCTHEVPADIKATRHLANWQECNEHDVCNVRCTGQQRCLSCDSIINEDCRKNATKISASICSSAETSSCFACEYNDWSVKRGCGRPPKSNVTHCYECDEAGGCNLKPLTRCYACTGDTTTGCATWEWSDNVNIEECEAPAASCVIATFSNSTTIRGCQSAKLNCELSGLDHCYTCEGNFCNKGAFPVNGFYCHQCFDCSTNASKPLLCALKANAPRDTAPACLEYRDLGRVVRGCRSNTTLYYECMLRNAGSGCKLCHANGCNASPIETLEGN